VFTNPFLNGYLDGFTLILEVRLTIPVSKKKIISGDEDVTFLGEDNHG
jgi:hypothetical protein